MNMHCKLTLVGVAAMAAALAAAGAVAPADGVRPLPPPMPAGRMSLEEAIRLRRSVRQFANKPLTIAQIGQMCWAGQGITDPRRGFRAAPSAGALYPMELYVVTPEGVEHYRPKDHCLERHLAGDHRRALHEHGRVQEAVQTAPATFVIAAEIERSAGKYRDRAERYCFMEAGHIAQNILLQATALRLGGVPIGGIDDDQVAETLQLPKGYRVLYVLPVGYPLE
jgi:SagB-type dehydrogenase family enzyme